MVSSQKDKEEIGLEGHLEKEKVSLDPGNKEKDCTGDSEDRLVCRPPVLALDDVSHSVNFVSDHDCQSAPVGESNRIQLPDQEIEPGQVEQQRESGGALKHYFWYGLPKSAKAALVLCLIGTVLLIAYSITAVSLSSDDEEAHIATVIIILSVFTLFATADAIIYENTLQLVSSIILSMLFAAVVGLVIQSVTSTVYLQVC